MREHWHSRFGFIVAAAGSAIGLGNIWKFPYMVGQNGGGAFLVIYLVIVFSVGLSVMLGEFVIGRAAERNPVGAFARLKGGAWTGVGFLGIIAAFVILSFYNVVAGWTLAYVLKTPTGLLATSDPAALGAIFDNFISDPIEPLIYHGMFMALTVGVVLGGIGAGIERVCKILMPLLFIILVVLVVRALTLPGAMEGLAFFLTPDFSKIDAGVVNAALAQAFFSLSLGMGAMLTYSSYLSHKENLPSAALSVTVLDTLVALLAGAVILPAVFAFGFDPASGPGLTFKTLPAVFSQMPAGALFGTLFFLLLAIAALTSAISLLEVVVAYFVDEKNMPRRAAATLFGFVAFLLGIPSSLSLGIWKGLTIGGKSFFGFMDYLATNLLLPIGGIFVAIFVGWVIAPKAMEEVTSNGSHPFSLAPLWRIFCRYVAPVAVAWILFAGL